MAKIIDRSGVESLIVDTYANEIISGAVAESVVLSQFTRLPNMTSKQHVMPVLSLLPQAYFVDGDTGLKQTTNAEWKDRKIVAEEIAVIVPIPEAVLDDADYDVFAEITPRVVEAFGKKIDGAVLFGADKPTSWRESLVDSAISAGNVVTESGDLFLDIFGEDGVIAKVEEDGFIPNGYVSSVRMRGKLRGLRDDNKNPIFTQNLRESSAPYALDGSPIHFAMNGAFDVSKAELIAGDFSQAVYSIRQDMTVKFLDQAVISDNDGKILYNLAQQDMVALRFVMRLGWEVTNGINAITSDYDKQFPFSVLQPKVGE